MKKNNRDDDIMKTLTEMVEKMRDYAIKNNVPEENASIEEKVSYETMKATFNYNRLSELYLECLEKKMLTADLLEQIYEIYKPANDKSDILIKKLENQLDGE